MPALTITRRPGERFRILQPTGRPIWVEIVEVSGNRVRVRIIADSEVVITREELLMDREESE